MRPARVTLAVAVNPLLAHGGTGGLLVELGILVVVLALFAAVWLGGRRERADRERRQADEGRDSE